MNMQSQIKAPRELTIVRIGDGFGVILPYEVLAHLGVGAGDSIDIVGEGDDLTMRRHDKGFAEQMEAARAVMARRRDALAELAK